MAIACMLSVDRVKSAQVVHLASSDLGNDQEMNWPHVCGW